MINYVIRQHFPASINVLAPNDKGQMPPKSNHIKGRTRGKSAKDDEALWFRRQMNVQGYDTASAPS